MKKNIVVSLSAGVAGLALLCGLSIATPDFTPPAGASGTVIVPDRFLRRWDPITIFFPKDVAKPGPEDRPEDWLTMTPHPGAFTWIDARTLQFRPAEPWPALSRISIAVKNRATFTLATLMNPPAQTIPADGSDDLEPVGSITLTFPEPIDAGALAEMTRIELRPRPGLDETGARWIDREDFVVKTLERAHPSDPATYVLQLEEPIPESTRAIVHFKLSLEDRHKEAFADLSFSTLEAFRVISFGCHGRRLPVTPEGTTYTGEQAISCSSSSRSIEIELSSEPSSFDAVVARNLIRFTPSVDDLEFESRGRSVVASASFEPEKRYQLSIHPTVLTDHRGRLLDMRGASKMSFFYPRKPKYLNWQRSYGTVERFGPKTVPMDGRGFDRVDLRIYPVDPLDRTWWPFVARPVVLDESRRPPSPGEQPEGELSPSFQPTVDSLGAYLAALGSPPLSRIVELPIDRKSSAHTFGLELAPHLRFLSGENKPGHYLVGIRRLDGSNERHWMRLEVTDLSLSVAEEPHEIRFFVTSLRTGRPVPDAKVRVEGLYSARYVPQRWETFFEGTSDSAGAVRWQPPGAQPEVWRQIRRVVVEKDGDFLVIDPDRPPERFQDDRWLSGRSQAWLQWAVSEPLRARGEQPQTLCHLFTERPVYRPEEEVHIGGYVRRRHQGALSEAAGSYTLAIRGSGDLYWKVPVELGKAGSFHHVFKEEQLPTGVYTASLTQGAALPCEISFRMEAYRLPSFEVRVLGEEEVAIDRAFEVKLSASYYAGGPVAARPVRWRVTQFPYTWSPPHPLEGFVYSTDSRYSRMGDFQSTPTLSREARTDERGGATIELNPAVEPTAQPRAYVVEATIAGADDQTVTGTKQVRALPPFVLGLKVPRFLEKTEEIRPEVVMVDPNGAPIAGGELVVRLIHRTWHSHLQASDFSDGVAKYITDVVEEKLMEKKATSAKAPIGVSLPIEEGGVYVVEVEARDRLGRAQVVAVDLFAAGDQPISWKKPEDKVFNLTTDKDSYDPGETAKFVLQSPFLTARALAIVEGPDDTEYHWLEVKNGVATFSHRVAKNEVPRLPVHFVLMRGRLEGAAPKGLSTTDLGKPSTMAATKWIAVNPIEHRVEVALEHPEKARPGEKVKVEIRLSDPKKKPLSGEVMLWLVDQAVLALGTEQKLDPLDAFITQARTYLAITDTRNGAFGRLPLVENPGGDAEAEEASAAEGLLDKVTVRKNFKSVPVFLPSVHVGPSGETTVTIALPDNLTNFKVRAKAVSGVDRFGYAKSMIAVRLPVIVQPAMPRFVRTGDLVTAGGIARVVEGEGGAGRSEISVKGGRVRGKKAVPIELVQNRALPIRFPLEIDSPLFDRDPKRHPKLIATLGVERKKDGAKDAFAVELPIRADRGVERRRILKTLAPGETVEIEGVTDPIRAGTAERTVLISDEPALVRMAAGLDFLVQYPHGSTEARVSRARAFVAMKRFRRALALEMDERSMDRAVEDTLDWIAQVVDGNGLCAHWPGSHGYVSLTAWTVELMVEAKQAGYRIDASLLETLIASLERALRSDYPYFITGEQWAERVYALDALARAQRFSPAYAAELSRKAEYLNLESTAGVVQAFAIAGKKSEPAIGPLSTRMWDGVIFRLHQGNEIYGGLQERHGARSSLILPSETRTLAELLRALDMVDPSHEKLRILTDALVTLGRDDGWGSTNANAAAMLALVERIEPGKASESHRIEILIDGKKESLEIGKEAPTRLWKTKRPGPMKISALGAKSPVIVRIETSYVPAAPGSAVEAESRGFVVTRESFRIKESAPAERIRIEEANKTIELSIGDVVEEHVQVVNPKDRSYVAITVPLAAGMEPMNAKLATSPAEARPNGRDTSAPTHLAFLDDRVTYYFNSLPKGTFDFYFRTRASTEGTYTQPAAHAEMMYDGTVTGRSPGAKVIVKRSE